MLSQNVAVSLQWAIQTTCPLVCFISLITVLFLFSHVGLSQTSNLSMDVSENPFKDIEIPEDCWYKFEMIDGVIQIISADTPNLDSTLFEANGKPKKHPYPSLQEFFADYNIVLALSTHGPMWVLVNHVHLLTVI